MRLVIGESDVVSSYDNKVKIKSWFFEKMEFTVDTRKFKNGLLQLTNSKPIHKNRIVVISYERFGIQSQACLTWINPLH